MLLELPQTLGGVDEIFPQIKHRLRTKTKVCLITMYYSPSAHSCQLLEYALSCQYPLLQNIQPSQLKKKKSTE